ncbi:hypothetical protein [Pseudomonas sp. S1(2024)]|uniref:hypothetical protein n=1 Tax=Pseudomonas sp. S1(2024) TaxID=3390191 RepID=UPI0039799194
MKPRNTLISEATRQAIKACQGTLSLAAAAKKFGVSRRSVGRIYHGGELSTTRCNCQAHDIDALRQQVEALSKAVLALTNNQTSHAPQRLRRILNPEFHGKSFPASEFNFSSPYRDQPGIALVRVYGVDIPVSYLQEKGDEPWFVAQHPASPECSVYPYPAAGDSAKKREANEPPPIYCDPPAGTACTCKDCRSWRTSLAYEEALQRAYVHAVAVRAVFRGRR